MRIAALVLTVIAALACLWFFSVSEMLIRPGNGPETIMRDDYYAVAHARAYLPYAMLALFGGAMSLALWQRPRRRALWLVLAGGFLAIAFVAWDNYSLAVDMPGRVPTYFDVSGDTSFEDMLYWLKFRRWLLWAGLGLTLIGWAGWLACRFRKGGA
jgi:hypothetical protein